VSSAQSALRTSGAPLSTRLSGWLTLARVSNSPTVASNVLAGAALAGVVEPNRSTGLLVLAMVAFYTAGMLLNDVCDYGWDMRHRPDRPLVVGLISRRAATVATVVLFGAGGVLLWLVGARALLIGVVLAGLIVLYDAWHKTNPFSPLVMAACRLMVYVGAFAAFAWPPTPMLAIAGGLLVAHLVGLTAIAKSEARPTVVGYWPAALLFLPPLFFATQIGTIAPVLAVLEAAWVVYSIRFVYRPTDRRIGAAIARLIAGISLLDTLVLASLGAGTVLLVLGLAAFGLTLLLQRYVEGT
jgi:4-hydroxybenzoate polyprenyltransferase